MDSKKTFTGETSEVSQQGTLAIEINHSNKIRLGLTMKALGYESANHNNVPFYKVVPVRAA